VFTPDRGKLRLIAKGARKPSSRKSGHVELFCHSQFLVAIGRELDIVTQAETLELFQGLREALLPTTYAYYIAELADAFTGERDENRPVFDLLKDAFGWLAAASIAAREGGPELGETLSLLARYYELHLLSLVGYQPQLFVCVGCQERLEPQKNYMSPAEGGVLCPRCGYDRVGTLELSLNALKILRFLQTREWETCRLLQLTPASHAEAERTMNEYITYYLERRPKSVDFLQRLRRQMEVG
jgi:DNA repair protein RecO (recombination protein O)